MKVSNVSGKVKNSNKSDNAKRASIPDSATKYVCLAKLALNVYQNGFYRIIIIINILHCGLLV